MATLERNCIEALARCVFAPASFDKRFARELAALPEDHRLSREQRNLLYKMVVKYRRQLPDIHVTYARWWLGRPAEQRGFEAALDDDPSDWDTRAVYADWLEDAGAHVPEAADLALAQRWIVVERRAPLLVPCGKVYGPNGGRPCNFEWTFGMDPYGMFGIMASDLDYLPYHHVSREQAEVALGRALRAKSEASSR